jgi:hypothetical protein
MLIYLVEVPDKCSRIKIYLFEVLKKLKILNMFFDFIGCQLMSRNFPKSFRAFEIFVGQ